MKQFIQIALATGHVFEVPAKVIAENRAAVMLEMHPDEFADLAAATADSVELFDDGDAIRDWALNNMNPKDYLPRGRMIRFNPPAQEFDSAEWSFHDQPALSGEMDAETIMQSPVEAVLASMAGSEQSCNVSMIGDVDNGGKPFAAVVVLLGPEATINTYVNALSITSQMLASQPASVPNH